MLPISPERHQAVTKANLSRNFRRNKNELTLNTEFHVFLLYFLTKGSTNEKPKL